MLSDFAQYQQILSCGTRFKAVYQACIVNHGALEWRELEKELREGFTGDIAFGELGDAR